MAQEKSSDQTEKPTAKRLRDARKEGQVHRSQDLSKTVLLLVWLLSLWLFAGYLLDHMLELFQAIFQQLARPTPDALITSLYLAGELLMRAVLPLILLAATIGLAIEYLQVGPVFAFKRIAPKIEHLNPAQGVKRMFSQENLVEVLKALIKTTALVAIVGVVIIAMMGDVLSLPQGPVSAFIATYWKAIIRIFAAVIFVFFFLSVLDVVYQRHAFIKNLKMSRRDIKQEHKESEGDPLVKGQRRQLHQEWSQQNTLAAVRRAKVVVTNPTHLAVALLYEPGETELPTVVAKGEGYMAALIREAAEEAGVPIMQNVDLARGLYSEIEIDSYITADFFAAVAEVLRWAESIRQEREGR